MYTINFENLKKGDILYKITDVGIIPCEIESVDTSGYNAEIEFKNGGIARLSQRTDTKSTGNKRIYFTTKEEAENFLEESEKNKIKKKKLYELELKLNEELNINTFLIKY